MQELLQTEQRLGKELAKMNEIKIPVGRSGFADIRILIKAV